eukprot:9249513-Pyramimonas_sp.AAC.1
MPDSEPHIDERIKVKASFAFSVIQYNVKSISVEKKLGAVGKRRFMRTRISRPNSKKLTPGWWGFKKPGTKKGFAVK